MEQLKIGDYVLATKYSDADPGDNWAVGWLNEMRDEMFFVGNAETHSFRHGGFRACKKIPAYLGEWLLANAAMLESSPPGSINLLKMTDTVRNNNEVSESVEKEG